MRISDIAQGDRVLTDAGFTCMVANEHTVEVDERGPFVRCDHGKHYLEGQIGDDGELIGITTSGE